MRTNRWDIPHLGYGIGLRTSHYGHVLSTTPEIDWFEVISENYLDTGGRPRYVLDQVAERYPVVMHGVSLSIGSTDPLNRNYLARLGALAKEVRAVIVSDHLCWTGVGGRNTHDLLPLPYTEEALRHTIKRARQVSEILERPIVLENPSSYAEFSHSTINEWEFLAEVAERADCGILLDINNVYVSAFNHGFDARAYIDAIPADRVVQYHLAGHSNMGTHIIDTHDNHVVDEVWELFDYALDRIGPRSTLIEWDAHIPDFDVVRAEALEAKSRASKWVPDEEVSFARQS